MALTDGILAYWKLDDTGWTDSTGNGYTLTENGGVSLGTGIINNGAVFSDTAGLQSLYVDNLIGVGTGSASASFWVNPYTYGSGGYEDYAGSAFSYNYNVSSGWLFIFNTNGNLRLFNGSLVYESTSVIPLNTWTHICLTRDENSNANIYINGSLDGSFIEDSYISTTTSIFGRPTDNDNGSLHYNGIVDEAGVWNRALSQAEVTKLYNLGNAIQYPFDISYYNNAQEDGDWGNLLNWWQDSNHSIQSTYLPTTTTHIVTTGEITQNTFLRGVTISGTGNDGEYSRDYLNDNFVNGGWSISYSVGVYYLYNGDEAVATSINGMSTWVSATYPDMATTGFNYNCVCHDAQFESCNFAYGLTLASSGVVNMQGTSVFAGHTTDGVSMHDSSELSVTSVVDGNVSMRDASRAYGNIYGNASVYYDMGNGQYPIGGYVDGSVTYFGWPAVSPQYFNDYNTEDGDFNNPLNWWTNENYDTRPINSVGTQELPDPSTDIFVIEYEIYANTGPSAACNTATFVNYGVLSIELICSNGATFNNGVLYALAYGSGQVVGNAVFNGDSYQIGYVTGNARFTSNASLNNSFNYQGNWAGLAPNHIGSFTSAVKSKKPISISSLLRFPWFINF
jgi:hypothetical protein